MRIPTPTHYTPRTAAVSSQISANVSSWPGQHANINMARFSGAEKHPSVVKTAALLTPTILRVLGPLVLMTSWLPLPQLAQKLHIALGKPDIQQIKHAVASHTTPQATVTETTTAEQQAFLQALQKALGQLGLVLTSIGGMANAAMSVHRGRMMNLRTMQAGGFLGAVGSGAFVIDQSGTIKGLSNIAAALIATGWTVQLGKDEQQLSARDIRKIDRVKRFKSLRRRQPRWLYLTHYEVAGEHGVVLRHAKHLMKTVFRKNPDRIPPLFKPHVGREALTPILFYLGGIPMLLMSGESQAIRSAATALISIGALPSSLNLFNIGLRGQKASDRLLLFAPILTTVGYGLMNVASDPTLAQLGFGIGNLGSAGLSLWTFSDTQARERANRAQKPS